VIMESRPHIPEKILTAIWQEQRFNTDVFTTTEGLVIRIIRRGRKNSDNGPDFKNALIRIGSEVCEGDVELHLELSDWRAHGHDKDPAYNHTILHVVLWSPPYEKIRDRGRAVIRTAKGDSVPSIVVQAYLSEPVEKLQERFFSRDEQRQERFHQCHLRLTRTPAEDILQQIRQLGRERLHERVALFERRQGQNGIEQLLYEVLCEGLGYSSNKEPFRELARRLPLNTIISRLPVSTGSSPSSVRWVQAMLFGTAGLLPKTQVSDPETRVYVAELLSLWEMLIPTLDLQPMNAEEWHFFRLRPPNFPTRRLAALSYLIADYTVQPLFKGYLHLLTLLNTQPVQARHTVRLLERTLEIPSSGYWKGRYRFGKSAVPDRDKNFLGQSRIRDIIVSAVLPVFLLHARQNSLPGLESQILQLYETFPSPAWNREITELVERLFCIPLAAQTKTALIYQGLLHLHKHFCVLPACAQCLLGSHELPPKTPLRQTIPDD